MGILLISFSLALIILIFTAPLRKRDDTIARGRSLNCIAEMHGVKRKFFEYDHELRGRLLHIITRHWGN